MDPDANLARQLELARFILTDLSAEGRVMLERADELAQLVRDLHEWLSRGGFKPKAWEVKP